MRNNLFILFFSFFTLFAAAQSGEEVFSFLRYPSSARANALGGHTVALVERDPSLVFHNPALLGGEMDGMVNLNYMNYISDINVGSALFTKALREHFAWGVGATFISYGNFRETTSENTTLGDFSAKDIGINGFFSYDLSERWRGGASLKFLYSSLESYTSIALGVDVGLSYYDSEKGFSAGFTLKNVGAQLKAYNEQRSKMPWDIQLGVTKKMTHAPIRFSLTAMYLNKWKFDYVDDANKDTYKGDNFFQALAKHFVIGIDYIPNENFWIGIGYNPKTSMDMKLKTGGSGLAGFSAGAGVKIKMFDIGASVAKYHPSAMSLMISVSTTISDFKP
ncbi:MAG: type IX secretion system protein PorQ [Tannerellaceae bacterium]